MAIYLRQCNIQASKGGIRGRGGTHEMSNRFWLLWCALVLSLTATLFAPTFLRAQSSSTQLSPSGSAATKTASKTDVKTTANAKAKAWVMPRTPDGHPDLHGYYNFLSFTPMERPAKYGNREFLT